MRIYISLILFVSTIQLSRSQSRTSDISRYLYNPFLNNYTCQEKTTDIQLSYNPGGGDQTPNPVSNYFEIYERPDHTCQVLRYTVTENSSLKLEGPGISVNSLQRNQYNTWIANVKFNASGTFQLSWQVRNYYPSNTCNLVSDTITYIGTYRKIVSIPPPPKPTLSPLKAVVRFPEGTLVNTSGCPNTLKDNDAIPPSYSPLSRADWSWNCGTDGKPEFTSNGRTDGNAPFDFVSYNSAVYKPGTTFRARCDDNGCVGEASDPVAVSIQKTPPACSDPKMDEIDNYTPDGRPDYHYYMTETVICNKTGDANCTQSNVFNLLTSSKVFAAPAAIDFTPTNFLSDAVGLGKLSTKLSLLGSKLLFNENQTPVKNCETANLAGPAGLMLNFLALTRGIGAYILSREATAGTPVANPVAQVIDVSTFSVTNYTQKWHILYPGKTTRIVVDACNQIKILTIGTGRSWLGDLDLFNTARVLKELNIFTGKYILFPNADGRIMQAYNEKYK